MDNNIKTLEDLIARLRQALTNNEPFAINASIDGQHGLKSVFFIGGKLNNRIINCQIESVTAMIKLANGEPIEADSMIRQSKSGSSYEKNKDGSITMKFKPNAKS